MVTVPAVDVCLHPSANKPVVAVHLAVLQSASFASITQKPVIIGKLAKPVDVAVVLFVFIFIIINRTEFDDIYLFLCLLCKCYS